VSNFEILQKLWILGINAQLLAHNDLKLTPSCFRVMRLGINLEKSHLERPIYNNLCLTNL